MIIEITEIIIKKKIHMIIVTFIAMATVLAAKVQYVIINNIENVIKSITVKSTKNPTTISKNTVNEKDLTECILN